MVIKKNTLDKIATGLGVLGGASSVLASSGVIDQSWANLISAAVTVGLGYMVQKPTAGK